MMFSSLICPGLFPDSSWDEAANLLRQSMDSPSLRTWDGRAPAFNAPPPAHARSFRDPPLRPDHSARLPLLGVRTPPVPTTLATPTTTASPITAPYGARAVAPLGAVPPSPPTPHPTLRLSANLPHTAAAAGAGRIPVASISIAIPPAALDPEVTPAPPLPIEVDSPTDLSRSGARLWIDLTVDVLYSTRTARFISFACVPIRLESTFGISQLPRHEPKLSP